MSPAPATRRLYGDLSPLELVVSALDNRTGLAEHLTTAERNDIFNDIAGTYTRNLSIAARVALRKLQPDFDTSQLFNQAVRKAARDLTLPELLVTAHSETRALAQYLQTDADPVPFDLYVDARLKSIHWCLTQAQTELEAGTG